MLHLKGIVCIIYDIQYNIYKTYHEEVDGCECDGGGDAEGLQPWHPGHRAHGEGEHVSGGGDGHRHPRLPQGETHRLGQGLAHQPPPGLQVHTALDNHKHVVYPDPWKQR